MNIKLLKQFFVTFSEDEAVHLMPLISPPAYSRPTVERDGCHPIVHLWLHLKHCCFRLHPCKWMQCRSWGEKAVWAEDMAPHSRASPVSTRTWGVVELQLQNISRNKEPVIHAVFAASWQPTSSSWSKSTSVWQVWPLDVTIWCLSGLLFSCPCFRLRANISCAMNCQGWKLS